MRHHDQRARSAVLLVRHGRGRGRLYPALQQGLDYLAETAPELAERIRVYETGQPMPTLDGVAGVVFFLGDPLKLKYPDCYRRAETIAIEARELGIPVANPPEALARHRKSDMARIWRDAGLPTPASVRYENRAALRGALGGFSGPVILRADDVHGQEKALVIEDLAQASAISDDRIPFPGVVSSLVDTRATHRESAPGSVFARYRHVCRTFLFGSNAVQSHILFSRDPVVQASVSVFREMQDRSQEYRDRFGTGRRNGLAQRWIRRNRSFRAALDAEQAFRLQPIAHAALLRKAAALLDFHIVSFDYSLMADGSPILWEANPYPYINPFPGGTLWRDRDLPRVTRNLYEGLGRYLGSFLDE
jgi:hypothetical protein